MPGSSLFDWITQQEKHRRPSVFVMEWFFVFALAGVIWTATLSMWQRQSPAPGLVVGIAAVYACGIIYPRLFNATRCLKCHSPLPFLRHELDRHHVRDREQCVEVEVGGEAWSQYSLQLYQRTLSVDQVRFRCRRCRGIWQELEESPASDYKLVRTIRIDLDR